MKIVMKPIGYVSTDTEEIPRSWTVTELEGSIIIDPIFLEGLADLKPGQRIDVIFHYHKSKKFTEEFMRVKPPAKDRKMSVFNTHSPVRPNPIGMSVLEVIRVAGNVIRFKGLDMMDRTPILDIRPTEEKIQGEIAH